MSLPSDMPNWLPFTFRICIPIFLYNILHFYGCNELWAMVSNLVSFFIAGTFLLDHHATFLHFSGNSSTKRYQSLVWLSYGIPFLITIPAVLIELFASPCFPIKPRFGEMEYHCASFSSNILLINNRLIFLQNFYAF